MTKHHLNRRGNRKDILSTIRGLIIENGVKAVLQNTQWQRNLVLKVNKDIEREERFFRKDE